MQNSQARFSVEPCGPEETALPGAAQPIQLSVLVPVVERVGPIEPLVAEYLESLDALDVPFELICIVDGAHAAVVGALDRLKERYPQLRTIAMPRSFGEATAITVAFEASSGERLLILPAYHHVAAGDLKHVIAAGNEADVVVARREPRGDGWFNRLQSGIFSSIVRRISGLNLTDAGCSVRLVHRSVLDEVQLYGDFHRFLPLLANQQGFSVQEVAVRQSHQDERTRVYAPGIYLRRLLDLISVYFVLRFTKKPFRFFGLIGFALIALGGMITAWVTVERLAYDVALADRPALLLGSLLMVFGLQVLSVGLIGEIVIFAHARQLKEFNVRRIVGARQ